MNDDSGGYLVPEIILKNKAGFLPAVYRWLGLNFGYKKLYEKGTYEFRLADSLRMNQLINDFVDSLILSRKERNHE